MFLLPLLICCLHPQEDVPLRGMGAAFETSMLAPVPVVIWDALWLPLTPEWETRKEWAKRNWLLFDTFIPVPDGEPIPAIGTTGTDWWTAVIEFLNAPDGDCPGGCQQTAFWN